MFKKCTICGTKCDNIGNKTSEGVVKEWCDSCAMKRVGIVSWCYRCL